ncbi:hypothetical protein CHUAL_006601 [Chamberlinius hualienensis]
MMQFEKKVIRAPAVITLLFIMMAIPVIVHAQYFAKTGKSLPRLGRRVDPAMYDLLNERSVKPQSISPVTSLFKGLDTNADNCLTIDEFSILFDLSAGSRLNSPPRGRRDDKIDDQIYDHILSAVNDK